MRNEYSSRLTMIVMDKAILFVCVSAEFKIGFPVPDSKPGSHVSQARTAPHLAACPPCQLVTRATLSQMAEASNLSANGGHLRGRLGEYHG